MGKRAESELADVNLSAIFRIFTATFALVTTSTLVIQYFRQAHQPSSEYWDDGIYLLALLAALFVLFEIVRANKVSQPHWVLTVCALVGITLGIVGSDHPDWAREVWTGFGLWPLLLALVITPWVWRIIRFQDLNSFVKYAIGGIVTASFAFSLLSLYQGANSIIYAYHSSFIINESLAVAAGHWPYVDFIPQYQMGNAFFLVLFKSFLTTNQLVELGLIVMSLVLIATVIIGVVIVRACLPNRSIFVAAALVVPITCVTPFPNRFGYRGSIAEFLSAIPVRIFPGVIILGALSWTFGRSEMKVSKLKNGMIFVGLLCGLILWNSQDFGIALVVSIFVGLLALKFLALVKPKFIIMHWLFGLTSGFLVFPVSSMALGKNVHVADFGFFLRQYGGGYGSAPIHTPGPVLLIFPLIISILCCSVWVLKRSSSLVLEDQGNLQFAGIVSLLFSIWVILAFPYYINRSFAGLQLQIFLLPTAIAFGALVGAILQYEKLNLRSNGRSSLLGGSSFFNPRNHLLWPISLVSAMFFASILLTPNPQIELQRLSGKIPPTNWSVSSMAWSISDAKAGIAYTKSLGASVGFVGLLGNYVQLESGIESASIFNSPEDIVSTPNTMKVFCSHLLSLHLGYLVLGETGPQVFPYFPKSILCGKYSFKDAPGVRAGHMAAMTG